MEYTRLGSSGLTVSRIALGCMSFGDHRGFSEWSLSEEESAPFFRQAVDLGITLWDTANVKTWCWRPSCTSACTTVRVGRV